MRGELKKQPSPKRMDFNDERPITENNPIQLLVILSFEYRKELISVFSPSTIMEEREGRSILSILLLSLAPQFHWWIGIETPTLDVDGLKLRTVLYWQKRAWNNRVILNNKAETIDANGLEASKIMDNESFSEEETAFLDVKRAKIGERRQIHLLQLHSVSSSACNSQALNR